MGTPGREAGVRSSWWRSPAGCFQRYEVALIAAIAIPIVVVNKALIRDQGNTWSGLILTACYPGALLVVGLRVARERRRR